MTTSKKTILVVEDELPILNALSIKLKKEGFRVVQGRNGEEAVVLAKKERPDLILMDIVMPRLHGIDALLQIRAHEWGKTIYTILLSNLGNDPRALEISNKDEYCEYLVKSDVKIGKVIEKIKMNLDK